MSIKFEERIKKYLEKKKKYFEKKFDNNRFMSSFEECYLTVLKKNSNKMLGCDKITAVFNLGELRFQYHSLSRFQQCRSSDYRMPGKKIYSPFV